MGNFILVFLFLSPTFATRKKASTNFVPSDQYEGLVEKNGINLKNIKVDFLSKFSLVSTHFRDDRNQLRFIYANSIALEGLRSESHSYRAGAIFYKAVYGSMKDPLFEASWVPIGNPSVQQIMVYDPQKYTESRGWGYAVFGNDDKTLGGNPQETTKTCFACHQIASERNSVFSYPLGFMTSWMQTPDKKRPVSGKDRKKIARALKKKLFSFQQQDIHGIDPYIQDLLRTDKSKINIMNGTIMSSNFTGYLSEVSSFLENETLKNGLPSLAIKDVSGQVIFNYTYIDGRLPNECQSNLKLRKGHGSIQKKNKTIKTWEQATCVNNKSL